MRSEALPGKSDHQPTDKGWQLRDSDEKEPTDKRRRSRDSDEKSSTEIEAHENPSDRRHSQGLDRWGFCTQIALKYCCSTLMLPVAFPVVACTTMFSEFTFADMKVILNNFGLRTNIIDSRSLTNFIESTLIKTHF